MMANELTIRIAGEAGQGMQTIGFALNQLFKKSGFNIFANQDYMSRIRGGNNFFQLRISSRPLYTLRQEIDIVVALDKSSVALHKPDLAAKGIMIADKNKFNILEKEDIFFDVPLYDMAMRTGGSEIFSNSVACGVIAGVTGISFSQVEAITRRVFSGKSEDVIKKNVEAAKAGYEFTVSNFKDSRFVLKPGKTKDELIMNGNHAIALAVIKAGCKFYSAYPMTPSTSIMDTIAHYAQEYNIVVEQAEDEIAAINMAIGASFAGVRSMTASSGGGFALMAEGVSLAGMLEIPVVIAVAQRPAPATGFPTRTEQAELEFVLHAGHGEFARVVYAPGTIEQAFYLTLKAFNTAEKYQIPVFILTDQHLADSERNVQAFDLDKIKVQRHIIAKEDSQKITNYKRYQFTASGISPRAVPSWIEDPVYVDSDEHTEEGHITEDAGIRQRMVEKRFYKKMAGLCKEIERPSTYNLDSAEIILFGFGSTYGVMKEAAEKFTGKKIGVIHLSQVWPFPSAQMARLCSMGRKKKIFNVENNAGGQLARLLRRETGMQVSGSILRFDGRPFNLDYLMEGIRKKAGK